MVTIRETSLLAFRVSDHRLVSLTCELQLITSPQGPFFPSVPPGEASGVSRVVLNPGCTLDKSRSFTKGGRLDPS